MRNPNSDLSTLEGIMVEIAEAMRESVEAKRVVDKALEAQDALRQ